MGWAVGDDGLILKTDDAKGGLWLPQSSGTSEDLYAVFFINPKEGWAVGDNGTILFLKGQAFWIPVSSTDRVRFTDVFFAGSEAKCGWIIGQDGLVRQTKNGGQFWMTLETGQKKALNATYFLETEDSDSCRYTGWAIGAEATLIHSTNGGTFWTDQIIH